MSRSRRSPMHVFLSILTTLIIIYGVLIAADYIFQNPGGKATNTDGLFNPIAMSAGNHHIASVECENFSPGAVLSVSMLFDVTPGNNVKGLKITFKFYDENDKLLTTVESDLGNVSRGAKYTASVSLNNFSLTQLATIKKWGWDVTGGALVLFG